MEDSFSTHFLTPLLILLTFTTYITSTLAARAASGGTKSTEFIRTSCRVIQLTPESLCYTSLSTHARVIQTSPQLLAQTALTVTLENTQSASVMMTKLLQSHGMSPREVVALNDCVEELGNSVDELRKSLGEMNHLKGSNFDLTMSNIQTWVSAAMTNEDTCTEGFSESSAASSSNVKNVVRGQIVNIAHLTSNALALVNSLASIHS